jgi:hypothetical protein
MAQTEKPLGPAELLEHGRNLIEREPKEMTSTVLLGHFYIIAASICQHLSDLERALDRMRDKPPADKPPADKPPPAHYRRDEGSHGQGSRA